MYQQNRSNILYKRYYWFKQSYVMMTSGTYKTLSYPSRNHFRPHFKTFYIIFYNLIHTVLLSIFIKTPFYHAFKYKISLYPFIVQRELS